MKNLLVTLLAIGSLSSFAQSTYDLGYSAGEMDASIPDVVTCGQIKKLESYVSGEIALDLINVKTGFIGETLYNLKKEHRVIRFSGKDEQALLRKSMILKSQLLADKMMSNTVCVSTEYIDNIDSLELINHVTSDYSLENAIMKIDQKRGTNTKLE
jgi:hypothetical protein